MSSWLYFFIIFCSRFFFHYLCSCFCCLGQQIWIERDRPKKWRQNSRELLGAFTQQLCEWVKLYLFKNSKNKCEYLHTEEPSSVWTYEKRFFRRFIRKNFFCIKKLLLMEEGSSVSLYGRRFFRKKIFFIRKNFFRKFLWKNLLPYELTE